jgi:hypothetical protein
MLEILNNKWIIIISIILIYFIVKKIIKIFKPIDVDDYYKKLYNQEKLKKKLSLDNLKINASNLASYYFGVI